MALDDLLPILEAFSQLCGALTEEIDRNAALAAHNIRQAGTAWAVEITGGRGFAGGIVGDGVGEQRQEEGERGAEGEEKGETELAGGMLEVHGEDKRVLRYESVYDEKVARVWGWEAEYFDAVEYQEI
jgi:hypothetical protein